jgi:PAS domain-containing protein
VFKGLTQQQRDKFKGLTQQQRDGFKGLTQQQRDDLARQLNIPEPNVEVRPDGSFIPIQRKYLPTLSDLVDRLTIVQLKAVFISEHSAEYVAERALIEHDIDLILEELASRGKRIGASEIHAIIVIMLSNRFIWENESLARKGGPEQDRLLKLTHSINGVRNTAKNQLAAIDGGRKDYKIDSLSAELTSEFGNWKIFE